MSADGSYAFSGPPGPDVLARQPLNDLGNAMRLILLVGGRVEDGDVDSRQAQLLYLRERGWIAFNGQFWDLRIGEELARRWAHKVSRSLASYTAEALAIHGVTTAKWWEFVNRTGGAGGSSSMLTQAASYLGADLEDFDADPLALNVANGVLRFRHGADGPEVQFTAGHNAADRFTRMCVAPWTPKAKAPDFARVLVHSLPDEDVRHYYHKVAGYGATQETKEQNFFILQGRGGDGKSTLMNAIRETLGGYAFVAGVETFLDTGPKRAAEASPDLARLAGDTRLISTAEPPRGAKLASAMVKSFTGGAPITARELRQGIFEFTPIGKVILECNNRPAINDSDQGIWRRIRIILFTRQIAAKDVDLDLPVRLRGQREGILVWLVEGVLAWMREGLTPPLAVRQAIEDYRRGGNSFGDWVSDRLIFEEGTERPVSVFWDDYKEWCAAENIEKPMSSTAFGRALGEIQILLAGKDSHGRKKRSGARLRTDADDLLGVGDPSSGDPKDAWEA